MALVTSVSLSSSHLQSMALFMSHFALKKYKRMTRVEKEERRGEKERRKEKSRVVRRENNRGEEQREREK